MHVTALSIHHLRRRSISPRSTIAPRDRHDGIGWADWWSVEVKWLWMWFVAHRPKTDWRSINYLNSNWIVAITFFPIILSITNRELFSIVYFNFTIFLGLWFWRFKAPLDGILCKNELLSWRSFGCNNMQDATLSRGNVLFYIFVGGDSSHRRLALPHYKGRVYHSEEQHTISL